MTVGHSLVVSALPVLARHQPYQELGANDVAERRRHQLADPFRGGSSRWAITSVSNRCLTMTRTPSS
jgi:hypothetical protein